MIIINGTIDLHSVVNFVFVIPEAINKLQPTGGVIKPMAILTTMMRPKWTIPIPKAFATGYRMGDKIRIAGVVSMMHPTISNIKFSNSRINNLLSVMEVMVAIKASGRRWSAKILPNTVPVLLVRFDLDRKRKAPFARISRKA